MKKAVALATQTKLGYVVCIILTGGGPATKASIFPCLSFSIESCTSKAKAKIRCFAAGRHSSSSTRNRDTKVDEGGGAGPMARNGRHCLVNSINFAIASIIIDCSCVFRRSRVHTCVTWAFFDFDGTVDAMATGNTSLHYFYA